MHNNIFPSDQTKENPNLVQSWRINEGTIYSLKVEIINCIIMHKTECAILTLL
jgi:hypothetical protein